MIAPGETPPGTTWAGWKKDAVALGLLLVLVLPLRLWLFTSAVTMARDGIGFIRYALEFEQFSWQEVWEKNHQHPGFPLAMVAVSQPVRWVTGTTDPDTMQRAAQLTALLAALLLLYPMYHLGRLLFNRRVGFGAALLFQYLPISAHHLSDGISESLFLLLAAASLLQAVRALHGGGVGRYALCSLCTGLAYLTRPEGTLILAAVLAVLLALQCGPSWRLPWRRFVASGAALVLLWAACASLYVYATGRLTSKLSALQVIHEVLGHVPGLRADLGGGPLFAIMFKHSPDRSIQVLHSTRALTWEVSNGFHYLGVLPAVLGLVFTFPTLRRRPGFWVLALYCTLHTTVLMALAMAVSYVSDRHVMVLVLCGSYFVSAALWELPRRCLRTPSATGLCRQPSFWSVVLFAVFFGFCLPKTLQPLHANRAGNRAAGEWLREQLSPGDEVDDDHCWSHYYAGRVFLEHRDPPPRPGYQPLVYIVITRAQHRDIGEKRRQREEQLMAHGATLVWPPDDAETASVVVYRIRLDSAAKAGLRSGSVYYSSAP